MIFSAFFFGGGSSSFWILCKYILYICILDYNDKITTPTLIRAGLFFIYCFLLATNRFQRKLAASGRPSNKFPWEIVTNKVYFKAAINRYRFLWVELLVLSCEVLTWNKINGRFYCPIRAIGFIVSSPYMLCHIYHFMLYVSFFIGYRAKEKRHFLCAAETPLNINWGLT